MRRRALPGLLGVVIILGALGVLISAQDALAQTLRFTPSWFFYARDTAWFVAIEKGYFREEGLEVKLIPGKGGADAVKNLTAGAVEFGGVDSTSYLLARHRGAPFLTVGMWHARAPFSVVTFEGSGIERLKDLEGKTVGAPSADSVWRNLPGLAEINGVDFRKIRHVEVQPPAQNAAFMAGNFDASTAYVTQLPMLRGMAAKQAKKIKLFPFANYGYDLYGQGIVTTQAFVQNRTDELRRFLRAAFKGAHFAIENPDEAVKLFLKHEPTADPKTQREVWDVTVDLWLDPESEKLGLGHMTEEKYAKTRQLLMKANKLDTAPEAKDLFTNAYLPKFFPKRGPRVFSPVF